MINGKDAPNSNNYVFRGISLIYGLYNIIVISVMFFSLIIGFLLPSLGFGNYWFTETY